MNLINSQIKISLIIFILLFFGYIIINILIYNNSTTDPNIIKLINSKIKNNSLKEKKLKINNEAMPLLFLNISKIWERQEENLPLCPETPPNLKGKIKVDLRSPKMEEIEEEYKELMPGGHWRPNKCKSRNRMAIIVPFRDRMPHLLGFLHNIHKFLQHQQLDYAIFVIEQFGNLTFNKGRMMNAGVLEAMKLYPWQCVTFHDVDTLPDNDKNLYSCPTDPKITKHLGVVIDKLGDSLYYDEFLGGVTILTEEQFRKANGFSNSFWGWGEEDDDFYERVKLAGMEFWRPESDIGTFRTFKHEKDKGNPKNNCSSIILNNVKELYKFDGLSTTRYRIKFIQFKKLFTHIMVEIPIEEYIKWKNYTKNFKKC